MSRIGVLGSSGGVGRCILASLKTAGHETLAGVRRSPGPGQVRVDEDLGAALAGAVDVVIDASPSRADKSTVAAILDAGTPVVGVGHALVGGRSLHVRCAGALPGILTAAPLLLDHRGGGVEYHALLAGALSRTSARDILEGARRSVGTEVQRDARMPGVDAEVDLVAFQDEDTRAVDALFGAPIRWLNAWAGRALREALFRAVGMDAEEASASLAAASLRPVLEGGSEVIVHVAGAGERILIEAPSIAGICAWTAVACAVEAAADPGPARSTTAVELLGERAGDHLKNILTRAGARLLDDVEEREEGEL